MPSCELQMQVLTVALQLSPNGAFIFFCRQPSSGDILDIPFLPFAHFLSLLPPHVPFPPPPPPQSLLDWWSKHRKRAGSVLPRQSRGWAFLRSSCAGVKSLLWFSFHLSSANHRATLMRMNSDPSEEFHSKDRLMPVFYHCAISHLPFYALFPFFQPEDGKQSWKIQECNFKKKLRSCQQSKM